MTNFLKDVTEIDKNTSIAVDEMSSGEFSGFFDTGSYMLNAAISGSIYGGIPNNKITAFAGVQATGKTFFALSVIKSFLNNNKDSIVVYYDSESAVNAELLSSRDIDTKRVVIAEPETVQDFRTHALKTIEKYEENKKDNPPVLIVLDSLGQLSTSKEIEDTSAGKETRDMTRAQMIKSTFRVLSLKLARAGIPMIITNHVYDSVGSLFPTKEISGGTGLKYSATTIVMLTKKKDKDGTDVVGNIIKATMYKSRLTKENTSTETKLSFVTGLDRYYGLVDLAVKHNIFKKIATRIELPDGSKQYEKTIYNDPEKYFTKDILEKLDQAAEIEYGYGRE